MDGIKHSNQIFLFPCMQQLTDMLPNFSHMKIETNCACGREASGQAGLVVRGSSWGFLYPIASPRIPIRLLVMEAQDFR
jgi:hypothetical protein